MVDAIVRCTAYPRVERTTRARRRRRTGSIMDPNSQSPARRGIPVCCEASMQYEYTIITDHYQFYVEDEECSADTSTIWDTSQGGGLLAVNSCLISIGTVRYGGETRVIIQVLDRRPIDAVDEYDHVVEASIEVPSGRLVVWSPENEFSTAPRISVRPGIYGVRVCYGNTNAVADTNATSGDDYYKVVLWPAEKQPVRVLK